MNNQEFRVIPGYAGYGVTNNGVVKSWERDLVLNAYPLDGYFIVDTFRGSLTETLPVHRAVALAWVANPRPDQYTIVNHRDGSRTNNWFENLEWTDYSGNNYHAVNTGLRSDNIRCLVRDFLTGQVCDFSSVAQAAEFMGLPKDSPIERLNLKKFGSLISDRFEFKFEADTTPWFYEDRTYRVPPSRYMVTVHGPDNQFEEVYSTKALLKSYQLYDCSGRAIPELAQHANQTYPDKIFKVRDSYAEEKFRQTRQTETSQRTPVVACHETGEQRRFDSLTKCANDFGVDRSSIQSRIGNGKNLNGWTFTPQPL